MILVSTNSSRDFPACSFRRVSVLEAFTYEKNQVSLTVLRIRKWREGRGGLTSFLLVFLMFLFRQQNLAFAQSTALPQECSCFVALLLKLFDVGTLKAIVLGITRLVGVTRSSAGSGGLSPLDSPGGFLFRGLRVRLSSQRSHVENETA